MSWNEPGGNKKDPWSGRDQRDTPPDLEEVMGPLLEKLGGLFGGSGKDGGTGKTLAALAAIPVAIWALTGIYIVDEGNRGVVTRFGKHVDTTPPGPHWRLPFPIESHTIVNVEQQRFIEVGYRSNSRQQTSTTMAKEALMLTQDENIIDVKLSVQYQIKDAKNFLFNVADPDVTLRSVTESAERGVIGKNTMDSILTGDDRNDIAGEAKAEAQQAPADSRGGDGARDEARPTAADNHSRIANEVKTEIQKILDQYEAGIRVVTVSFKGAQPPEEVQSAFDDAIKAREDEQRLKNEAEAYRNDVLPKANGAAARLHEESEAYRMKIIAKAKGEAGRFEQLLSEYQKAPEITRQRLYLDTLETVFDKANTVLVDLKAGNNMVYLPIDKLQRPQSLAVEPVKDSDIPQAAQDSTDNVVKPVRGGVNRGREGRTQ